MVISDERREVAAFLRNNCVLDDYAESLSDIAGYEYPTDTFDVAGYLADLIDPTCEMRGVQEAVITCSACGAPLVQPGYAIATENGLELRSLAYCPNCGARVVKFN